MKILITGASGFIGNRLVKDLLSHNHEIFLLVRPKSKKKVSNVFSGHNIKIIEGDIEKTDILSNISSMSEDIDSIECVVHLAALYEIEASLTDSYMMNVVGTQNMINFIQNMKSIKYFHYFSTYAVNPSPRGAVSEDFLTKGEHPFHDNYSKTKNDAEHLVRKRIPSHITTIIHRPGVIIGDSEQGQMDKSDGPYYFFNLIQKLKNVDIVAQHLPFIPLPLSRNSLLPVLPVDILVKWSSHIIRNAKPGNLKCYHLIPKELINTKTFLEKSMSLMGLPLKVIPINHKSLFSPLFPVLNLPKEIIHYMQQETLFLRANLEKDYPELAAPSYQEYLPRIIDGYLRSNL
jgi:thioester reductase-like protein